MAKAENRSLLHNQLWRRVIQHELPTPENLDPAMQAFLANENVSLLTRYLLVVASANTVKEKFLKLPADERDELLAEIETYATPREDFSGREWVVVMLREIANQK